MKNIILLFVLINLIAGANAAIKKAAVPLDKLNDKAYVLKTLEENPYGIKDVSPELVADPEFKKKYLELLEKNSSRLNKAIAFYLPSSWLTEKNIVLLLIETSQEFSNLHQNISLIDKKWGDDPEIASTFMRKSGGRLEDKTMNEFISDRLKDDKKFILNAIKNKNIYSARFIQYVSNRLKDDKEIILKAINKNHEWELLQYSSNRLKDDKKIILSAVSQSGEALQFASDRLKDDGNFVFAAIKKRGYAFKYASNRLKDDKKFVLAVINETNDGYVIQHASNRLKDDKEVILEVINKDRTGSGGEAALQFASNRLVDDKQVVLAAVKRGGYKLERASDRLKDDEEIVALAIVMRNGDAFQYASDRLKNDRRFLIKIIDLNPMVVFFFDSKFKDDEEIIKQMISASKKMGDDYYNKLYYPGFISEQLNKKYELESCLDVCSCFYSRFHYNPSVLDCPERNEP